MLRKLYWALGLFSVVVFSFGLGMAAVRLDLYPNRVVNDAKTAFVAVQEARAANAQEQLFMPEVDVPMPTATTFEKFENGDNDELILVTGGRDYYTQLYHYGCLAWLMDRQGNVKHYWKFDPSLWDDLKEVARFPGVSSLRPLGIHLFPNGDILVNFQCWQCFPFGVGMARFDKDSNLLWKRECLSHHWFSVTDDGLVYVPTVKLTQAPIPIGETNARITHSEPIHQDFVTILDGHTGEVQDEISMLDALIDSGWHGLIWQLKQDSPDMNIQTMDPLHLNDVRVASLEDANRTSWLNAGDLLVSFRNLNAVGILDAAERKFKWIVAGCFVRQHSPRFFDDGILVFDNLGGPAKWGGSQLVKISFERNVPERVFPTFQNQFHSSFSTDMFGHLDLHPTDPRVLITLMHEGRIWEVNIQTGRLIWEYLYADPVPSGKSPGKARLLYTAKYAVHPNFPFNRADTR